MNEINQIHQPLSLEEVAQRVIWWKTPEDALKTPNHLIAHAMAHGLLEDILILQNKFGLAAFQAVLKNPPAGIFDKKSWVFWHIRFNYPLTPLPTRRF